MHQRAAQLKAGQALRGEIAHGIAWAAVERRHRKAGNAWLPIAG